MQKFERSEPYAAEPAAIRTARWIAVIELKPVELGSSPASCLASNASR